MAQNYDMGVAMGQSYDTGVALRGAYRTGMLLGQTVGLVAVTAALLTLGAYLARSLFGKLTLLLGDDR